jgi:hypothetical protein
MKRRLINSAERRTKREKQVALVTGYLRSMVHWQRSIEAAAREARVSATCLARTMRISCKLHPSMLKMFDRGQIDTRQADRLTRLRKNQQRKALQAIMLARPLSRVVDIARLR